MGTDPDAADNRWLREAMENRIPLIYFLGAYQGHATRRHPGRRDVTRRHPGRRNRGDGPGSNLQLRPDPQETALERRYALRQVKARLHQTMFRAAVIAAYGGRCALSSLPEASLLDAAHIAADRDELLGQPVITNGLPLTKLHHAAFDNHLIGISPDYRIAVSKRL